jgi:predicted nucleic acid-binding protein
VIVLFDTHVVLDHLMVRKPFENDAATLFVAAETGVIDGFLCDTTITTIHYIARKSLGKEQTALHIGNLLAIFQIASVTPAVIRSSLGLDCADFEDAVLHESAVAIGAEAIVTRNARDFSCATAPIYEPPQLVGLLGK